MGLTKVTSGAITDSAITSAKIEDGTIVNADISSSAAISQSKLTLTIPTVSSITIQNSQGAIPPTDTSLYFDVVGTNFTNPSTVELLDSSTNASTNATTVTYVSATQLRVTASLSAGTYKIRVIRSDGFAGNSATALLTVSQAVSWSTSAGSLGTFEEGVAISTITLSATSNSAVTYAIQSGSLPSGLSLNTSNGQITGTPGSVSADTTSTFTVRATDAESQYADREFTITVSDIVIFQSLRFNDDDNAYLSRTLSASPTNQKIVTLSYWAKRGNLGVYSYNFVSNTSAPYVTAGFLNDDTFSFIISAGSGSTGLITTAKYRDTSAWYHMLCVLDTTQATSSDRVKIYINGVQITDFSSAIYPAQDSTWNINTNVVHSIGGSSAIQDFDGYMAEVHFIDGQALTPSSFGSTDSTTGHWKPKVYSGSYGTNGFYLDFADSNAFGDDESGNTNDFTATNLAATDQVTDTPQNNFATLNAINNPAGSTLSEGNCKATTTVGTGGKVVGTMGASSGKWYCEVKLLSTNNSSIGIVPTSVSDTNALGDLSTEYGYLATSGTKYSGGSASAYGSTYTNGDIIGVALDLDAGTLIFYKNGVSQGTAFTGISGEYTFGFSDTSGSNNITAEINFGNPSFSISSGNADQNGYGNFEYAPPTGYLALCTNNLPEPTIKDSSAYFHTQLYSGNSTDNRNITNDANAGDFKPDFLWIKERTSTSSHQLIDSTRGSSNALLSDSSGVEDADANRVKAFLTDGFQVGTASTVNESGQTYVAWQWKANAGTTSSNTDGSITSTVQANTTAGFSIVTYTGNATAGATVGHGLGKKPDMIIAKNRTTNRDWLILHKAYEGTSAENMRFTTMALASAGSQASSGWYRTAPTSSVFYLGNGSAGDFSGDTNLSGSSMIAYCFAEIEGYSKFGKYIGNGNADGAFVYTGFKPAFVIYKRTDAVENWQVLDAKRDIDNPVGQQLYPNLNASEGTENRLDFVSNGFKLRNSGTICNASGGTYIYMAFAESPFGGILTTETTAR